MNACDAGKVRLVGNVAIDIGKERSHIVVELDDEIVRERVLGYNRRWSERISLGRWNLVFIVEASSTLDRVAKYLESHGGTITIDTRQNAQVSRNKECTERALQSLSTSV